MPLTDPVPSSAFDVLERNIQDTDKFVNQETGTFTNRVGKQVKPIPVIEAEANAAVISLGWHQVGLFADGFTYTLQNDIAKDTAGDWYRWNGSLPKIVTAGTFPSSDANFVKIDYKSHADLSDRNPADGSAHNAADIKDTKNGGSVQDFIDAYKERGFIDVRDYGAKGNGVDNDTAAIQAAIDKATTIKTTVWVPLGTYKVDTLILKQDVSLVGEDRNSSVLIGSSGATVVSMEGQFSSIKSLYIRGGSVGVKTKKDACSFSQIVNCRIQYNRIGVLTDSAYIMLIKDSLIMFNQWGFVGTGQDYQVVIRDNVIDNNLGGGGVLLMGSSGYVIDGNTIEGNRNESSPGGPSNGFGIWVVGFNQRLALTGNWFEQNGNQGSSSDIIIGSPFEQWVSDLADATIPTEYLSLFKPVSTSNPYATGQISVDKNFFYSTKRFVAVEMNRSTSCTVDISNSCFVGIKNKNNRAVEMYGSGSQGVAVRLTNNRVINTADITIGSEMLSGNKKTYAFHSGTTPAEGVVTLDGVDLFTAVISTSMLASLAGASMSATARIPTSGAATVKNGNINSVGYGSGTTVVQGSGKPRLGTSPPLTVGVINHVMLISASNTGGYTYQTASGFIDATTRDSGGNYRISQITPVNAEMSLLSGDYVAYVIMNAAAFEAAGLKGCTRLKITDLLVTSGLVKSTQSPSAGSSSLLWTSGDIVYNSNPASGAPVGWVCTSSGAPGAWGVIGTIA